MAEQINVISGDLDGAQLKREMFKNSYHTRCCGKGDHNNIQEAVGHVGRPQIYLSIPAHRWESIFGG